MALLHRATLTPTKLELLTAWLPGQTWFTGIGAWFTETGESHSGSGRLPEVSQLGSYRFDDPIGEVGMEGFVLATDDESVLHIPMTYRSAPLAGADDYLIGTTEHSVLGRRWVYDGCGDPIWVAALATTVLGGGSQADEFVQTDGELVPREPTVKVRGSGSEGRGLTGLGEIEAVTSPDKTMTTVVQTSTLELVVVRVVGAEIPAAAETLTGRWARGESGVLAGVRLI
jgi:hypothetical protein